MMKKRYASLAIICTAALLAVPGLMFANEDHEGIEGPFETPMDVTATCLECHEDASEQVMATSHWTWELEQDIPGIGKVMRGKKNSLINNFCIAVPSNWPRCTSCHIGYGWKDADFDFNDPNRVDCLSCHDTTGIYNKAKDAPAGSGMPPGYTGKKKYDAKPYDLVKIAQNVGLTTRSNCLNCHANGGGGNNVKHGDIDQSLLNPTMDIDVHMASDGNNFTCQECHVTEEHNIKGNSMLVSPGGDNGIECTDCHNGKLHEKSKIGGAINKHVERVACQTCHIPEFAKKDATKMSWDWSQAKDPKTLPEDKRIIKEHGHKVYIFKKGKFTYEMKVAPTYAWYNGTAEAYMAGDKIDPNKVTSLNKPVGSKDDPNSKIMPFKVHKAVQPYDTKFKYIAFPKVWGPKTDKDAFWVNFDWKKAITAGMEANGLEFSGEYGFTKTETYWPINHMVSPADKALRCKDCHGNNGRLDWKALGYAGDPKKLKKKAAHK